MSRMGLVGKAEGAGKLSFFLNLLIFFIFFVYIRGIGSIYSFVCKGAKGTESLQIFSSGKMDVQRRRIKRRRGAFRDSVELNAAVAQW